MFMTILNYIYYSLGCLTWLVSFTIWFFHTVLPLGMDLGIVGVAAYFLTRLKRPDIYNVTSIFGPSPGTKESDIHPDKVVKCIAHRGAGLDAPENTMEAFQYCIEQECNFVELDVRTSRDGKLVILHDKGLERLAGAAISDVRVMDWDSLKQVDVGATHPNRQRFKEVHLCLLDEALDYLMENNAKVIIDVKGEDSQVVEGIVNIFQSRPRLYRSAAVTCFNPFILYQIRKKDPNIVGALSYRPYGFSAQDYDAENGPSNPRYSDNMLMHGVCKMLDGIHSVVWRWSARWCAVSAVLLHKDIVSLSEVCYWRGLGVRCIGWCVNRPLEKLYWRGVLKEPYLANTLVGEPEVEAKKDEISASFERADRIVDNLLEPEREKETQTIR